MKYYISQTPANPVTRIVAALLAVVCLIGAFFFGLVILAILAVLIAAFSLVFWLRAWWLNRHAPQATAQREFRSAPEDVIEAEYTVVSERRD
jgi:hypothetical protein